MSSDFDPNEAGQASTTPLNKQGTSKRKGRQQPEIPAPTEPIVKTTLWWSTDLAHLSTFEKCVLNNMEVLGAQMTQVMMQLERNTTMLSKMKNRRGSMSSVATSADTSVATTARVDNDDDEPTPSQEQVKIQEELQSEEFRELLTTNYDEFIKSNKKKPYKLKVGSARQDAKEFHKHLQHVLTDPDDGLAPGHAFTELLQRASDATFLDVYVELGQVHASNTKSAKKPTTTKKVQTVGGTGSQAKTIIESFSQSDSLLSGRKGQKERDDDDDSNDDDDVDDTEVTLTLSAASLRNLAGGSVRGARGGKSAKSTKASTKKSSTKTKKRSSVQRGSPTSGEELEAAARRRARKGKMRATVIPETEAEDAEFEEEEDN